MDDKGFFNLVRALKIEILTLLQESDLTKDKEAQRVLMTIDNTFNRLGKDVEDILPGSVLQEYFAGLEVANNDLYVDNITEEKMTYNFATKGIEEPENIQMIQATLATHLHGDAVAEVTENLMMDLKAAIRTAKENANASITDALAGVQQDLQSGLIRGKNRKAITNRVMDSFDRNGFNSFTTVDGRQLPLDFYSETVTRTNLRRANTRGAANRYRENKVNLFKVSGGYPTCSECAPYRNIVFSMDRDNEDFPYLNPDSIPFHPNCQCTIQPYVIKYKFDDDIEKEKEKARNFDPAEDTRSETQKEEYRKKQGMNRKNNYEKKRYAEIKAIMGDESPKTLGAFKRMKRADTDNYRDLIYDFNESKSQLREEGIL